MVAQHARCTLSSTTLVAAARSHFRYASDGTGGLRNLAFLGADNCTIDQGLNPRSTSEPVVLRPSHETCNTGARLANPLDSGEAESGEAHASANVEPRGCTAAWHVGTRGEIAATARLQRLDVWPVWVVNR